MPLKSLFSPLSTTVTTHFHMSSLPRQQVSSNDELFERVVELTLTLDAMLHPLRDEETCAAVVDYVRAQLAAVSCIGAVRRV